VETKFKRSSYYNLADSELITLLQKGPVAVAVSSVGWDSYSSGVLSCSSSATVDHAVVAIGYTSTAIVIKNSWGTSWGISGYGLVSRNSLSNCKITDQAHIVESSWESKKLIVLSVLVLVILMIVY
jgi:C1A family cysteine protease